MQCCAAILFTGFTPMQDQILISANQTWPVNVTLPEAKPHAHISFQCDWTQLNICWNADCCASLIVTESSSPYTANPEKTVSKAAIWAGNGNGQTVGYTRIGLDLMFKKLLAANCFLPSSRISSGNKGSFSVEQHFAILVPSRMFR